MMFYESLLVHGREKPFQGKYYRNLYFHWMPVNWNPDNYSSIKREFKDRETFLSFYADQF